MKNKFLTTVAALTLLTLGSCSLFEVEDVPDLNNPTVESVLNNASAAQVSQLAVGVQGAMRNGYYDMSWVGGSVGREIVVFNATDNRYYTELQGQVGIDPGGIFYPWYNAFNATRRRAELFYLSAQGSNELSAEQKKGCEGFAKTVQAWTMLNLLNMMGEVGIRTEFSDLFTSDNSNDLLNPGPFKSYEESLAYLKKLNDDAATALDGAGTAFSFTVTSGWAGFNTPANFKKFNRALAARIAMYQKDWAGMNTALAASFLDLKKSTVGVGPRFTYSTTAGDLTNQFFQGKNGNNRPIAVQNKFVPDAEAGDTRVFGTAIRDGGTSKIFKRTAPVGQGGYAPSEYEHQQYPLNTSPVSIIRNEELILMHAEAKAQTNDLTAAVAALDTIRMVHGLKSLAVAKPTVPGNKDEIIKEVLNQRRYSLFMEGSHRWFDMRRYNRLTELPLDLTTHKVWANFPKPQAEVDWDNRPR